MAEMSELSYLEKLRMGVEVEWVPLGELGVMKCREMIT